MGRWSLAHQVIAPAAPVVMIQPAFLAHLENRPRKANAKGNSPLLAPVRTSFDTGKPVEWKRVHKLPEYAYFNHAVHVNKGVSCVSCHGQVNEMPVVRHDQPEGCSSASLKLRHLLNIVETNEFVTLL